MNRTRLLFIGFVALALGAFVAFVVYKNLQSRSGANNEPGVDVVLATNDVQVGAKLGDRDVRLAHVPASVVAPNSYHSISTIIGRGMILPIQKGEFILPSKLAAENAGSGLPSLIPPGMRAVSVRVNEVVAVAGFVVPGTRVDVLLTGNPTGANEPQTTTVLENVAVIAAGQKLERNAAGEPQSTPVITLLVSPDDAQRLTLASSQGHIQLALRNPVDTKQQDLPASKTNGLYTWSTRDSYPFKSNAGPKNCACPGDSSRSVQGRSHSRQQNGRDEVPRSIRRSLRMALQKTFQRLLASQFSWKPKFVLRQLSIVLGMALLLLGSAFSETFRQDAILPPRPPHNRLHNSLLFRPRWNIRPKRQFPPEPSHGRRPSASHGRQIASHQYQRAAEASFGHRSGNCRY